jgi:hypothetical protein
MNPFFAKSTVAPALGPEMFPKKFAELARWRRENGERIRANAGAFKVCSGCLSLFRKEAAVCCFCKTYRWLESPQAVQTVVLMTSRSALPYTAAVAPRFIPVAS